MQACILHDGVPGLGPRFCFCRVVLRQTELGLGGNQITDIAPLSAVTSLTGLTLGFNQITDIAPLSALTSLTELFLFNMVEAYPCNSEKELVLREQFWMDQYDWKILLNQRRAIKNKRLFYRSGAPLLLVPPLFAFNCRSAIRY
eukprot:SAG22_NODE_1572_length_4093_cov_18.988733_2_plen_144_part_00